MPDLTLSELNSYLSTGEKPASVPIEGGLKSDGLPLSALGMYAPQKKIDVQQFDLWYEKAIRGAAKAGTPGEVVAGGANNFADFSTNLVGGSLVFAGDVVQDLGKNPYEGMSFKDRMILQAKEAFIPGYMFVNEFKKARTKFKEAVNKTPTLDEIASTRMYEQGDGWRESLSKRMSMLGFSMYFRQKKFQESLAPEIDNQLAFDIGSGLGSFSRTILLGMVNPTVAIGAMTGEIGSMKFLEARAAGVPFAPSAVFATTIGVGQGQMERLSLGLLKAKVVGPLGLTVKAMVNNALEEFSQAGYEIAIEKAVGFRDSTLQQDVVDMLYEGFVGMVVGGVGGSTVTVYARNRIAKRLDQGMEELIPDPKLRAKKAGQLANILMTEAANVQTNLLNEVMGIKEGDMDNIQNLLDGNNPQAALDGLSDSFEEKTQAPAESSMEEALGQELAKTTQTEAEVLEPLAESLVKQEKVLRTGREIQLDQERIAIEKEMTFTEDELRRAKDEGRGTQRLEEKLNKLSKDLESIHFQLADLSDVTAEQLFNEGVTVKGEEIERVRQLAQREGEIAERKKLQTMMREKRASNQQIRSGLIAYARKYLPKGERELILSDLKDENFTPARAAEVASKIFDRREVVMRKLYRGKIEEVLGKLKAKEGSSGQSVGRFGSAALQSTADSIVKITEMSEEEAAEAQAKISEQILAILNDPANAKNNDIEELAFANELIDRLADLDGKSAEELQEAHNWLRMTAATLRQTGKYVKTLRKQKLEEVAVQIADEIAAPDMTKKDVENLNVWQKTARGFGSLLGGAAGNFSTLMQLMSRSKKANGVIQREVVDRLFTARRQEANLNDYFIRRIQDMYKKGFKLDNKGQIDKQIAKDSSLNPSDGAFIYDGITLANGKTTDLKLTRSQARYWFLAAHNADNTTVNPDVWETLTAENQLERIREKIAAIEEETGEEISEDSKMFRDMVKDIRGNGIPTEILEDIFNTIRNSETDLAFISEQRKLYNDTYKLINPTYRKLFGANLSKIEEYVPWLRDAGTEELSLVADMAGRFTQLPGFTKIRKEGSLAPFKQIGDIDLLNGMSLEISHFVPFFPVVKDVGSFLTNEDVRNAININTDGVVEKGVLKDGNYYKNLVKTLELIGSRGRRHFHVFNPFVQMINNGITRSALAAKGSLGLVQLPAMFAALDFVSTKDFIDGINDFRANPKKAIEVMRHSPIMRTRYRNMMLEIQEIVKSGDHKIFDTKRRWDEVLFAPMHFGNNIAIFMGGWPILRAEYNKTGDINKAVEAFDRFVETTQQSAHATELSVLQASQARILFKFISQPLQLARREALAFKDMLNGRITKGELARKLIAYHILIPFLISYIRNIFKFEPKEVAVTAAVGPAIAVPLLGDLMEGMIMVGMGDKPKDASPAVMRPFFEVRYDIYKIIEGHQDGITAEELFNWYVELAQDVTAPLGLPTVVAENLQTASDVSAGNLPPEALFFSLSGFSNFVIDRRFNGTDNGSDSQIDVGGLLRR